MHKLALLTNLHTDKTQPTHLTHSQPIIWCLSHQGSDQQRTIRHLRSQGNICEHSSSNRVCARGSAYELGEPATPAVSRQQRCVALEEADSCVTCTCKHDWKFVGSRAVRMHEIPGWRRHLLSVVHDQCSAARSIWSTSDEANLQVRNGRRGSPVTRDGSTGS